jgi:hypothetical protein
MNQMKCMKYESIPTPIDLPHTKVSMHDKRKTYSWHMNDKENS